MALIRVADGEVATIVTSLQMTERPRPRPMPASALRLEHWDRPAPDRYRALFRRVGGPWLWFSRLVVADDALIAIVHDSRIEVFAAVDARGVELGLADLPGQAEAGGDLTAPGAGQFLVAGVVVGMGVVPLGLGGGGEQRAGVAAQ